MQWSTQHVGHGSLRGFKTVATFARRSRHGQRHAKTPRNQGNCGKKCQDNHKSIGQTSEDIDKRNTAEPTQPCRNWKKNHKREHWPHWNKSVIDPTRFHKRKRIGGGEFVFARQIHGRHAAQRGAASAHGYKKRGAKDKTKPTIFAPTRQRYIDK